MPLIIYKNKINEIKQHFQIYDSCLNARLDFWRFSKKTKADSLKEITIDTEIGRLYIFMYT